MPAHQLSQAFGFAGEFCGRRARWPARFRPGAGKNRVMLLNGQGLEVMRKLWIRITGGAFALCGCLIIADATLRAADPRYSFWDGACAIGCYVTAVIGVIGLTCGVLDARSSTPRRGVLGEDDLEEIQSIRDTPGYTSARKALLLDPYLGKWIQISGDVVDVVVRGKISSRVMVQTQVPGLTAFMSFSDKDYPLSTLPLGRRVTGIGKIQRIDADGISLIRCRTR